MIEVADLDACCFCSVTPERLAEIIRELVARGATKQAAYLQSELNLWRLRNAS
jgi:hypothetical protein